MARTKQKSLVLTLLCGVIGLLALLVSSRAEAASAGTGPSPDPLHLKIPGHADAFYYRAHGKGQKPVLMYLHGRGGNPFEDCRKWARVATEFGWVVCPQGPEDRGGGARAWDNNPVAGKEITDAVLTELRRKYKGQGRADQQHPHRLQRGGPSSPCSSACTIRARGTLVDPRG